MKQAWGAARAKSINRSTDHRHLWPCRTWCGRPALDTYGFALPRTWAELARIVPQMCRIAGISDDARRRAVDQMGEQQAAVAVAVTLQKFDRQEVTSPGGYLRALTERAAAGELHLARSVFGLVARNMTEALN
ncbi:replication initiation protein RepC [Mesorhizobium sp. M0814]|uniref:replication initiation protein RepC n=1 Tax=Mesorhizobium sp. M0814 TaxID=2957004 RepID=UPI00333BC776